MSASIQEQKRAAAAASVALIEPGMTLGLGSGSTAAIMVELLGARVADGLEVVGLPTSEGTAAQARGLGIPLTTFDEVRHLDLTIDGADELDSQLRLIKGGGGAHLREKIVASLSARVVIIADSSKHVATLGAYALPVEVVPFAAPALLPKLADLGCAARIRTADDGAPFRTDENNLIVDCPFGAIQDPEALARRLDAMPGVVEHGLFIGLAERALIGTDDGVREIAY
ncbi:MAG: ribose-5-phosphate isomerase RpiA [Pseudomonadota bacterium]